MPSLLSSRPADDAHPREAVVMKGCDGRQTVAPLHKPVLLLNEQYPPTTRPPSRPLSSPTTDSDSHLTQALTHPPTRTSRSLSSYLTPTPPPASAPPHALPDVPPQPPPRPGPPRLVPLVRRPVCCRNKGSRSLLFLPHPIPLLPLSPFLVSPLLSL